MTTKTNTFENALAWTEPKTTVPIPFITNSSLLPLSQEKTGHFPRLLSPLFSSHVARFKCNIPCSHKAKQARFKYNIPRSLSHKSKQARFKYNIPRYRIADYVTGVK